MKRARRKKRELPKYLKQEELQALWKVIDSKRDLALFQVAYFYGLRASELGRLNMSDLAKSRVGAWRLRVRRGKGSDDGEFAVPELLQRSLRAYLRERGEAPGPLFPSQRGEGIERTQVWRLFRHYCELAGITLRRGQGPHSLKHSCGTHLLELGEPITSVQFRLGHRNINNTMVYARITGSLVREQEQRLKKWGSR